MPTVKEQMILRALSEYSRNHTTFRNRHLAHISGLDRQDINHYLKKWEKSGYVGRNPLSSGEWILIDMPGLVASLAETTEASRLSHIGNHEIFKEDIVEKISSLTNLYAALRSLKAEGVSTLRLSLEEYLNKAINELRNERTYMHRKTYSPGRASAIVENNRVIARQVGFSDDFIDKLLESKKPTLTLVTDNTEPEPVEESREQRRIKVIDDRLEILKMIGSEGNPEWLRISAEKEDLLAQISNNQ